MDENVTKGQMKNLITDKPAPITVKLAQTTGAENKSQQLSQESATKEAKVQGLMKEVEKFCNCKNKHAFAEKHKKQDEGEGEYELGDEVCTPVENVQGIDCHMDGYNITVEALRNIVTDTPAPITVPLNEEALAQKKTHMQVKSDLSVSTENAENEKKEE